MQQITYGISICSIIEQYDHNIPIHILYRTLL